MSFLTEGLYFRKISEFEDKTEGEFQHFGPLQEQILKIMNDSGMLGAPVPKVKAKSLTEELMNFDKGFNFIQSWHKSEIMSRKMWSEYSGIENNIDGAIIVISPFTMDILLRKNLLTSWEFKVVDYVNDKSRARNAFFTKHEDYRWEKEERICIDIKKLIFGNKNILPEMACLNSMRNYNFRGGNFPFVKDIFKYKDENGFIVDIPDLNKSVEGVLVPNNCSSDFESEINDILISKKYNIKVKRVNVDSLENINNIIQ
ncbi:hypothetical protein [Comamonas sp. w2-DMI]|uniref:hypothetical protein n=1 Tax=Comamonas sp. w2-DMI TaxID=3126391 RepID=UPI0032E419EA